MYRKLNIRQLTLMFATQTVWYVEGASQPDKSMSAGTNIRCKGKAVTLCVSDVFMAHYNKIYSKIDDKTENT